MFACMRPEISIDNARDPIRKEPSDPGRNAFFRNA
jgi:hypothetical protein